MYDCIIIGMGPAGMSAAIYAKRSGLNTLILDDDAPGGLLNSISIIENYLGFKSVTGSELALSMFEHLRNEEVSYKIERVNSIKDFGEHKVVYTTKGEYKTKGVIIAIGRKPKKSGLANEDKYRGKGISYCAICDAALYKNKNIVVLGGGNSAFEEAIYLSDFAASVKILVRNEIKADETLVLDAKNKNIEVIVGVEVTEFLGDSIITGVKLNDDTVVPCDGVFIYYGYAADTSFLNDFDISDDKGYILVDNNMRTKAKFVYACGDIIKKDVYQISTAVSDGTIAALALKKDIVNDK